MWKSLCYFVLHFEHGLKIFWNYLIIYTSRSEQFKNNLIGELTLKTLLNYFI